MTKSNIGHYKHYHIWIKAKSGGAIFRKAPKTLTFNTRAAAHIHSQRKLGLAKGDFMILECLDPDCSPKRKD